VTDDPKWQRHAVVSSWEPEAEWVYGFDYIDEIHYIYHGDVDDEYLVTLLQDANYNVIAVYDRNTGDYATQYWYEPYGEVTSYADEYGNEWDADDPSTPVYNWHQFQGLMYDRESGFCYARGRYYDPVAGRFISQDPNGQALVLMHVLSRNAQSMATMSSFSATGQYGDGMNLYGFVRANPITGSDPTGLTAAAVYDWDEDTLDMEDEVTGQRLHALYLLNEGAKWAAIGLETAVELGASLIPGYGLIEAKKSLDNFRNGDGGFFDVLSIGLGGLNAATTVFKAARILGKVSKMIAQSKVGAKFVGRFRKFNRGNMRHNLKVLTGHNPSRAFEAHHVLPVKFEEDFIRAGINNIHKPVYGSWWARTPHRHASHAYNERWQVFFEGGERSREEVLDFAKKLAKEYGFEVLFP